jgi:drug/metabolite transporter (DMT)-like permease
VSIRVVAALLLLAVLWGSAFPGLKLALTDLSAGHLTLLRHLVASFCLAIFLIIARERLWPRRADIGYFFVLGLLGYSIYHTALNYGQVHVTAGTASLIIATAPALTAVVAFILLGERLRMLGWLGIAISFVGVLLIVWGDGSQLGFNPFASLLLLSALVTAFYAVLQKPMFRRYSPLAVTAYATWAGTIPMLIFLPGFTHVLSASVPALLAAVYVGVVPSAIAYSLFAYAISQAPVTLVAAFLYLVPVFSLTFSWFVLAEVPSSLTLLGGLIAISGIVLVNRSKVTKPLSHRRFARPR